MKDPRRTSMTPPSAGRRTRVAAAPVLLLASLLAGACGGVDEAVPPPSARVQDDGRIELTPEQVRTVGVRVETVQLLPLADTREIPAAVASPDTASAVVGSVVAGRVERVLVLPGDQVQRGQPLILIQSHEVTDALRDLREAEAQAVYRSAASGRAEALLAAGAISREEMERRRAEQESMEAELARSRELVERLSPSRDGNVVIRAPLGGTIFSVSATAGMAVLPGADLVHLGRTDVLWVTGWIPERLAPGLAAGDSLEVLFQALPETRTVARVVQIGGAIDPVRRAVELRAQLVDIPAGVRPGLFATLVIPLGPLELRAVLPGGAVQRTTSGEVVFVEESEGVYRPVPVQALPLPDGRVAVTGLAEGQRVLVEGAYAVRSVMDGTAGGGEL